DGDGNVCRRKLLTANDQPDASKKSPHTQKPHAKRSQRGPRLASGFLQTAGGLHQKCGRAILVPAMTKSWAKFDLVICDELGYLRLGPGAPLFFQFVAERHETGSLIITSNLEFSRWEEVFG